MADVSFIETDSETIYNTIVQELETGCKEPLYPGDERRIFGDALAAVLVSAYNKCNEACKGKLLQYASGSTLDALGNRYNCERISPVAAKTILRFSMKSAITSNVVIPKGTRVTPDQEIYFATAEEKTIIAGETSIDIDAVCMVTGEAYNKYPVGTINQFVDKIPFLDSVTNTIESNGGDDGEPYPEEDNGAGDEHYRERIMLAPTALSVAGPNDAYEYWARSADSGIADVAVISDSELISKTLDVYDGCAFLGGSGYEVASLVVAGMTVETDYTVDYDNSLLKITLTDKTIKNITISISQDMACKVLIVPIMENGEIPSQEVLDKVKEVCSADDVRPMTDQVIVQAPTQELYDIDITYYTTEDKESDCINTIEGQNGAVRQYITWQDTKMGRDINPDKLRSLCLVPKEGTGCHRITIESPAHTILTRTKVAKFSGNMTIRHVVEEE